MAPEEVTWLFSQLPQQGVLVAHQIHPLLKLSALSTYFLEGEGGQG